MAVDDSDRLKILQLLRLRGKGRGVYVNEILKMAKDYVSIDHQHTRNAENRLASTQEETKDCWAELQADKLIRSVGPPNEDFFCLTEMGEKWLEQMECGSDSVERPRPFSLEGIVSDADLLLSVLGDLDTGSSDAVFTAFRCVEERLRYKADAESEDHGVKLVDKALHPVKGCLKIPWCETSSEEEGVHLLFRGAFQLFKNPTSHRTVVWDRETVRQAVVLAALMLKAIDQAVERKPWLGS